MLVSAGCVRHLFNNICYKFLIAKVIVFFQAVLLPPSGQKKDLNSQSQGTFLVVGAVLFVVSTITSYANYLAFSLLFTIT